MVRMRRAVILALSACLGLLASALPASAQSERIELPPGFAVELYAQVPNARSLALGDGGTVFVGTRRGSAVYAVSDLDGDNVGETVRVVARGLRMPNGVAFSGGDLYVAEVSRVLRLQDIESNLDTPPAPEVVIDGYPDEEAHGWKYIAFGPDGWLYIPVGAPCNVCESGDPFASITRVNLSTGEREVYARGIRNSVGFAWHPETGELWFTNNGRDWMGDDLPPDALNRAAAPGLDFGFPYCHAGVPDPDLNPGGDCSRYEPPALALPAHVAPLGMAFYSGEMFPQEYRNQIFFAEHGSWNRSVPQGYRLILARFQDDGSLSYEVFASGWLSDGEVWGRPVDVLVMDDGALLVSDDKAGALWRISRQGE